MPSGISGDMFLGCLIDAGWSVAALQTTIGQMQLPVDRWSVAVESVLRGPLRATLVNVHCAEETQHRHLPDIQQLIEATHLPAAVKARAIGVFTRLAEAEAAVHGATVAEVHFHEVGALDAIIDIVGACAGLHELDIEQLYASGVPLGEGWTQSAHGRIPLPAPATLALLTAAHAPTRPAPGPGELVTPTGAALLAEFATFTQPRMILQRIGVGTGQKDFAWPNVARLWIGETLAPGQPEPTPLPTHCLLETNIDDMNPELYAAVSQKLFAAGALDVWLTAIQMKKGRPGVLLSVLGPAAEEKPLAALLLQETTTLGVRVQPVHRHEAGRELAQVATRYGPVTVKLKRLGEVVVGVKPEYEECLALAQKHNTPVRLVYEAALAAAQVYLTVNQSGG